jgi:hypothetical protein
VRLTQGRCFGAQAVTNLVADQPDHTARMARFALAVTPLPSSPVTMTVTITVTPPSDKLGSVTVCGLNDGCVESGRSPLAHNSWIPSVGVQVLQAASETLVDEQDPSKGSVITRAGMHSGPVVADVVGLRNPR